MSGGGFIGQYGARGGDAVPTMLAPGEVWLTQAMHDMILRVSPSVIDGMIVHIIDNASGPTQPQ